MVLEVLGGPGVLDGPRGAGWRVLEGPGGPCSSAALVYTPEYSLPFPPSLSELKVSSDRDDPPRLRDDAYMDTFQTSG